MEPAVSADVQFNNAQDGSKVSHFAKGLPEFEYDGEKPYAEVRPRDSETARVRALICGIASRIASAQLWMGTHPSCPSKLLKSGEDLKQYVKSHPELLGDKVVHKFGDDLPFLFKVRAAVTASLPTRESLTFPLDARAGPRNQEGAVNPGPPGQEARAEAARGEAGCVQGYASPGRTSRRNAELTS